VQSEIIVDQTAQSAVVKICSQAEMCKLCAQCSTSGTWFQTQREKIAAVSE